MPTLLSTYVALYARCISDQNEKCCITVAIITMSPIPPHFKMNVLNFTHKSEAIFSQSTLPDAMHPSIILHLSKDCFSAKKLVTELKKIKVNSNHILHLPEYC